MTQGKSRVPAIEGWFTAGDTDNPRDGRPRLIGARCTSCGTFFFPRVTSYCANPDCDGTDLEEVPLSERGKIWSFTANRYQPPPPYVAADPFVPYAIAAVELAEEKMVVLGQMVPDVDVDQLRIGMEVELTVGNLYSDDDNDYVVWKWKPADTAGTIDTAGTTDTAGQEAAR